METHPETEIEAIRLAPAKLILSASKLHYCVPLVRTDTHLPSMPYVLVLQRCGQSLISPTCHNALIYATHPNDQNLEEIYARKPIYRRTTKPFVFILFDPAAQAARDITAEFNATLNQ